MLNEQQSSLFQSRTYVSHSNDYAGGIS